MWCVYYKCEIYSWLLNVIRTYYAPGTQCDLVSCSSVRPMQWMQDMVQCISAAVAMMLDRGYTGMQQESRLQQREADQLKWGKPCLHHYWGLFYRKQWFIQVWCNTLWALLGFIPIISVWMRVLLSLSLTVHPCDLNLWFSFKVQD